MGESKIERERLPSRRSSFPKRSFGQEEKKREKERNLEKKYIIYYPLHTRNFAISEDRKSRLLEIRVGIKLMVVVRLKQRDAGENSSRAREKNKEATPVS